MAGRRKTSFSSSRTKNSKIFLVFDAAVSLQLADAPEFNRILGQAKNAEFSLKDHSLAAARYLRAAAVAGSPTGEGYARLQRARALMRINKKEESLSEYKKVLFLPPEVLDEYGVPLSLYAVKPLLETGSEYGQAVERIGRQLRSGTWPSPAGLYLMKDLVEQIIAGVADASGAAIRGAADDLSTAIHLG